MKMYAMRFGLVLLILSLTLFSTTSCYDRSVHLMEVDLSEGLIRIDCVHIENGDTEEEFYKIEVYKTLNLEEQEYVLSEINEIEFKRKAFSVQFPYVYGDGLIFYYTSYKLYVTPNNVEKEFLEPYTNETREPLIYDLSYNHQFVELLNSIKNCEI